MNILLVLLLVSTVATSPLPLPSPQTTAFRGGPITLSVQLRGQSGAPIENATVHFFHETHNELLDTAITNSSGIAQFIWMIPITHELGPILLNATFRGDPERFLLPTMVPIPLTIFAQLTHSINVTDDNGTSIGPIVQIGQRLFFHTLITDDNSTPQEAVTVQFITEPNQILTQKTTSQNGSLVFSCTINQTTDPYITITIKSLNHEYHNGTQSSFQFLTRNFTTHFFGLPSSWHPSYGFSLQGNLLTSSGQGIPNASIELLLESGDLLKITQTENNGYFDFDIYDVIVFVQGNRNFIVRYHGSPGYSGTSSTIGIIPSSPLFHQISILTISCLTIGTSLLTVRMKRSTKHLISH